MTDDSARRRWVKNGSQNSARRRDNRKRGDEYGYRRHRTGRGCRCPQSGRRHRCALSVPALLAPAALGQGRHGRGHRHRADDPRRDLRARDRLGHRRAPTQPAEPLGAGRVRHPHRAELRRALLLRGRRPRARRVQPRGLRRARVPAGRLRGHRDLDVPRGHVRDHRRLLPRLGRHPPLAQLRRDPRLPVPAARAGHRRGVLVWQRLPGRPDQARRGDGDLRHRRSPPGCTSPGSSAGRS